MPRLAATPITLTTEEQTALEKIARRPSTAQQIALRATIILRAAQGASHGKIARELGITNDTSRLWRNRWIELSAREIPLEERLQAAPRPGCPPTFTLEQITQLHALACARPSSMVAPSAIGAVPSWLMR